MQWASILSVAWMLWISGKGMVEGGRMPLEIKWYKMKGFAWSIKQRRCIWQFAIVWGTAMERMSVCWRSCSAKTVSGMCQMMMWGVQRSPEASQCGNQLNIYYLQKQMIKDLIFSGWVAVLCSCFPAKAHCRVGPSGFVMRMGHISEMLISLTPRCG